VGLLREVQRQGDALPPFDPAHFMTALPTIRHAYTATSESVVAAFGVSPEAGEQYRILLQRLMMWESPEDVLKIIDQKFAGVIAKMPRHLRDMEEGGGGRDVIDPFIVAFASRLLGERPQLGQDVLENEAVAIQPEGPMAEILPMPDQPREQKLLPIRDLLRLLIAHKCLMKIEDLIGKLHEEVLGRAAGAERVPEPSGFRHSNGKLDKETFHKEHNPFPGADARRGTDEFYQIKNKTGSSKGGDGKRLGQQFELLGREYAGSKRFYIAMLGRTLSGHRSMGAVRREDPDAVILVGLAAFQQLGRHRDTPDIVMELYLEAFERALERNHYDFDQAVEAIVREWDDKYGAEDPAFAILRGVIVPRDERDQSSETYMPGRPRGTAGLREQG